MGLTGTMATGVKVDKLPACEFECPSGTHPGTTDCGDDARYLLTFPDGGGTLHVCEAHCEELWERYDEAQGSAREHGL